MALSAGGCASKLANAYVGVGLGHFADDFAEIYNDYAMQGVIVGVVNEGGPSGVIAAALKSLDNTPSGVVRLAAAFSVYWAAVGIEKGDGAHGGAYAGAANNAAALTSAFEAAIRASITASESPPPFKSLISNVEAVVKTIIWAVTEVIPPGVPTVFNEVIQ